MGEFYFEKSRDKALLINEKPIGGVVSCDVEKQNEVKSIYEFLCDEPIDSVCKSKYVLTLVLYGNNEPIFFENNSFEKLEIKGGNSKEVYGNCVVTSVKKTINSSNNVQYTVTLISEKRNVYG